MLNKFLITVAFLLAAAWPVTEVISQTFTTQPDSPLVVPTPNPRIEINDFPFTYVAGNLIVEVNPVIYRTTDEAISAFTAMFNGSSTRKVAYLKRFLDLKYHVKFVYYPHSDALHAVVRKVGSTKVTSFKYLGVTDDRPVETRFLEIEEILYNLLANLNED